MSAESSPLAPELHDALLTGWGSTAPSRAAVGTPRTEAEVRSLFAAAGPRGIVGRGLGRSYGDAAQNGGGIVADLTRLAGVHEVDVDAATVRVDAGVSLDALMRLFVPLGMFPAVTPGTCLVTVGGAIAADIHGKNHHLEGGFGNHLDAFTLQTPQGTRYVTPDDDPELFWATCGGMGLTGIITDATVRLRRVETSRMRVDTERVPDIDALMARMEESDDQYHYSVAWIDLLSSGRSLGRSVLTRGEFASLDELSPKQRRKPLHFTPSTIASAPPWIPNGLLNQRSIRAFNEFWFRKAPRLREGQIMPLASFHHPLDIVNGWNRIYGSRGFLQYQFVVPFGADGENVTRRAVEKLSSAGCASFLAVLKRLGPSSPGGLSFPMPGWTLTLDVPAGNTELVSLFDELDELVLDAGGRLYLAKDSRAKPETIAAMYPGLGRFAEIRAKVDPEGVMRSDLARRLDLV